MLPSRCSVIESLESRRLLAADVPDGFTDTLLASGLFSPTAMAIAPDGSDRIFVTEQTGAVRVIKNGQLLSQPFATVGVTSFGEHGLLGVTFDPDFENNGYVYVYYTTTGDPFHNRLSRFTANGDVASGAGETILLDGDDLDSDQLYHDGGGLHFGPDGKLYIATGENEHPENSQSLNNLQGKILRINTDGSIPTDNPFYNTATGKNRLIWSYGLRNPFTYAFQPGTGLMYINDVGQNLYEEINQGAAGANYGWPQQEGGTGLGQNGVTDPVYYYNHSTGVAITGGAFYPSGGSFGSTYHGKYFFADIGGGWIDVMNPANKQVTDFATNVAAPVDLDVGPTDGALYYLGRADAGGQNNNGFVSVIRFSAGEAPAVTTQPANKTAGLGQSVTFSVAATGQAPLSYQWQRNGQNIAGATDDSYTTDPLVFANNGNTYRVIVSNTFGSATSSAATVTVINDTPPTPTITSPAANTKFSAGQTFSYSGTASDGTDGTLPASAFTWQVDYITGSIVRPFVQPVSGSRDGTFTIPVVTPYTKSNVVYRVMLSVTDSNGLTSTTSHDIVPKTANVSVRTNIPGLKIKLEGEPLPQQTFNGVTGVVRSIGVEPTQTLNGKTYIFDGWTDGGDIVHNISTPSKDSTYTALYVPAITKGLSATYFNNKNRTGTQVTRVDDTIDFNWTGSSPDVLIGKDTFSAQWKGKFQSVTNGNHTFSVITDGGVRLRVNGQIVINSITPANEVRTLSGSIALPGGGLKVPIVLDYVHDTGAATLNLRYATTGVPSQTVPRGSLYVPAAQTTTLAPAEDAFVQGGSSANTNFGDDAQLLVKNYKTDAFERDVYLRFDLTEIDVIGKAKLRVFGRLSGLDNANVPLGVFTAGKTAWGEESITWNTRPVLGSLLTQARVATSTSDQWWEFDLTGYLKAEKANGRTVVTLILRNLHTSVTNTLIGSKESANGPQLVVTS